MPTHHDTLKRENITAVLLILSTLLTGYYAVTFSLEILLLSAGVFFGIRYLKISLSNLIILAAINLFLLLSILHLYHQDWFSINVFIKSYIKLNFILIAVLICMNLDFKCDRKIMKYIKILFYIIIILQIIQYILIQFDIYIAYSSEMIWKENLDIYAGLQDIRGFSRPKSIFIEPSYLAIGLFNLAYLLKAREMINNFDIFLFYAAVFLTFTLTGIVAIIVFTLILIVDYRFVKNKTIYIVFSFLLIVFIYSYVLSYSIPIYSDRIESVIIGKDGSFYNRLIFPSLILVDSFSESPIFGSGIGTVNIISYNEKLGYTYLGTGLNIISMFYILLISMGLIGFILMLTFVIYNITSNTLRVGKLSVGAGLILFSIFHIIFGSGFTNTMFWVPFGISISFSREVYMLSKE